VLATFVYSLLHNRAAWYSLWCMSAAMFSLVVSFAIKDAAKSRFESVGATADSSG
jgi:hypothetical protein